MSADSPATFPLNLDLDRAADLCAWLADAPDNTVENYPGFGSGWSDPDTWPKWTDVVAYAPTESEPDQWFDALYAERVADGWPDDFDMCRGGVG